MFRFFKYIVLFLLAYKVIRMLFAEAKPVQKTTPTPPKDTVNFNNPSQNAPSNPSKFNDAEVIDYEEVK